MGAFSVATGVNLLHDEGVLPPNAARQAIAFTTPSEAIKLESDGLAFKHTATALAMEDETANGTVELSSAAMELLVNDLASPSNTAIPQQCGYPYGGWASGPAPAEVGTQDTSPGTIGASVNLLA